MTDLSDFDAPKRPWLGLLIPALVVLAFAGFYWFISSNGGSPYLDSPSIQTTDGTTRQGLVKGETYYLFASEIELYPTNLENDPWDGGENGPDIRYRILWQGNKVFESEEKDDALIADWSGLSLDLEWGDLMGKTISPDEAIKAARIRYEKGGVVEIVVEDDDLTDDDDAGRAEIELDDLMIGKNEIKLKKTSINAVRRINLRALPHGSSLKDLVELMK
jgi:hypothetical protein